MAWWRENRRRRSDRSEGDDRVKSSFDAFLERVDAEKRLAWYMIVSSAVFIACLLVLALETDNQAVGLVLGIPLVFFSYGFARLQEARSGRESLRKDVIALTNVFYQDPATINKLLEKETVYEYLQNLLQAALGDDEFGLGYWQQAVKPFIQEGEKGFRQDWNYRIDLIALDGPVTVPLPGGEFQIDPAGFWRLSTVATFRQQVKNAHDEYYVGCTFSLQNLPEWFRDEGFLLRELLHLGRERTAELAGLFSTEWIGPGEEEAWSAAGTLFRCEIHIADRQLEPNAVQISELGIRWRYAIDEGLQQKMAAGVKVRIAISTFQPRRQSYFPVNITLPTRHPTVQFCYAQTPLTSADVGANVFFSAEEPYRPELVEDGDSAKRIVLQTNREDWVFAGSGCIFVWDDEGAAAGP